MEIEKKSIFLKIIIVGDSSVGKTSVLNRYLSGDFENETEATIGYDYKWKTIIENNQKIRIILWDVAGQENFTNLSNLFLRDIHACLIVGDILDEKSMTNTIKWKQYIENNAYCSENFPFVLLANKKDLLKEEDINSKKIIIEQIGLHNGFSKSFLASAKKNCNIIETFDWIINKMIEKSKFSSIIEKDSDKKFKLKEQKEKENHNCC